ncbi:WAT1-related protein At1g70260 isoform X1 [Eutrema salsugineum]|uniref:WAT1-related protein At1g70260 isoform X1 n=1 Tax=Eutrema salsugineum TaxID=72664 RepID=UPI000CECE462|nr:WAT1-related protein At1g70260 isoform X1 [Eutrema salsugineum]
MEVKVRREEFVPFVAMAIMEACTIALTIMAKTALTGGMSPFVFVVYTNAFGSVLLLPFSFFFHKNERNEESIFSWPLLVRVFFLGFTGIFLFQNLAFVGLSFSSPIVVCAMVLLMPSFSFLLSVILGRSKLDWRNTSSRAKVMGTIISISGAFVEELYKGPFIRPASSSSPTRFLKSIPRLFVYYNIPDNWFLGCIFLAAAVFSVSLFNVVQTGTVKKYPHVMKVASFYSIVGTIQCLMFSLFMERDLTAWKIQPNFDLFLIIATCDTNKCTRKVHPNERTVLRAIIQTLWYLLGNTLWHQLLCQQSSLRQCVRSSHRWGWILHSVLGTIQGNRRKTKSKGRKKTH